MALWESLSRRLLLLTVAFVMLAEVLVFVPSVARFRETYLLERLEKAQIASMAALAAPNGEVSEGLTNALLAGADVYSVVLQRHDSRRMMLERPFDGMAAAKYDLRDASLPALVRDAWTCAFAAARRYIRVIGEATLLEGEHVEIVVDEWTLKQAMLDYAVRIFWLSLAISVFTGGMVFLAVNASLVRPMRRVIAGVIAFREAPEDPSRVYRPSGARGEIGSAEIELARTQTEVQAALKQKSRLAALGAAVAKINHDLRNILASAQLLADRLEGSRDPMVARVGPKLIGSIDRAVRLCRRTLEFGRADEPPPARTALALASLVDDVFAALGMAENGGPLRCENRVPAGMVVSADADQLFRALLNLARNAVQAMQASGGAGLLAIEARHDGRDGGHDEIDVIDTGPGLPQKALDNLFEPFKGAVRKGGTGLGLAIAAELARGHGGGLTLVESAARGSRFRLSLPSQPAAVRARRRDDAVEASH